MAGDRGGCEFGPSNTMSVVMHDESQWAWGWASLQWVLAWGEDEVCQSHSSLCKYASGAVSTLGYRCLTYLQNLSELPFLPNKSPALVAKWRGGQTVSLRIFFMIFIFLFHFLFHPLYPTSLSSFPFHMLTSKRQDNRTR